MIKRTLWITLLFVISFGCSGIRAPKERIARSEQSYQKDLAQLKEYLGDMPVDVVVEGYTPEADSSVDIVYSKDSVEATIKQTAIAQIGTEYTYLRPRNGSIGTTIRVPTSQVTRISADGVRAVRSSSFTSSAYFWPIILAVIAIISASYEGKANPGTGCKGGCLAMGLILGTAALVILVTGLLLGDKGNLSTKYEIISKTWILQ